MPVTELAQLRLLPGTSLSSPNLRKNLHHAKQVMESFSGKEFHFLSQIEDPAVVYIVGAWDSVSQHLDDFIPSDANQQLLELLRDQVAVESLRHVGVEQSGLPLEALVVSIDTYPVAGSDKSVFEEMFIANRHHLASLNVPRNIAGGWWVEERREDGKLEWVAFCGCDEVARHQELAGSKGFEEYGRIQKMTVLFDVKHAKRLEV